MTYFIVIVLLLAQLGLAGCNNSSSPGKTDSTRISDSGNEHAESEAKKIVLTAAQLAAAGIQLAQAGPASIRETLPLYGVIAPNAERVRDIAARYEGAVQRVDKKIGDRVRQGETLALVESNESLQTYAVSAPLAGVVTARNANPGEQTGARTLFTVADLSTVWVELALFPRDAARIRTGQVVRVKSVDAGLTADGTVAYVAPFGSSASQTVTARVLIDNSDNRWVPGLYASAEVVLSEQAVALAVHRDAIQSIDGKNAVFVQLGAEFTPRDVRLGRSDGEYSEVLEGLQVGDIYATTNSFVLKAELGKGEASHEH